MIDFLFLENLCRISIAFRHTIEVSPKVNVCEKILVVQVIVLGQSRLNMLTKQEICGTFLQPKVNISYIQQTMGILCISATRCDLTISINKDLNPHSNALIPTINTKMYVKYEMLIIFSRTW